MKNKYKRTEWKNDVTRLNAKNMNHIECGIEELYEYALEYNQLLAKDGIYIQQDLNNNIKIGQNVVFITTMPEENEIDKDVVYYLVDGDLKLRGIILKGRFISTTYNNEDADKAIEVTFSSSIPNLIEYTGESTEVVLSWIIKRDGVDVFPDSLEIFKDDEPLVITEDNKREHRLTDYVNKLGDTNFTLKAHFNKDGLVKKESIIITQTNYSYIGFLRNGETVEDIVYNSKKFLVNREYNLRETCNNGNFNDKYLAICIPYHLTLDAIYSHGIEIPLESPIFDNSTGYKIYKSSSIINPMSTVELTGKIYEDEGTESEPEEIDYLIGWTNISPLEFAELTESEARSIFVGYNLINTPTYSESFGDNSLFLLAYTNNNLPREIELLYDDQTQVKNFSDDNMINREDMIIDDKTYHFWGFKVLEPQGKKIIVSF